MISTYLFEHNNLQREGLKGFLAGTDFAVTGEFACMSECAQPDAAPPELIVTGVNLEPGNLPVPEFMERARHMRVAFPRAKLVILASAEEMRQVPRILHCTVDGYILRNFSRMAILSYLNLAMIGEKALPHAVALLLAALAAEVSIKQAAGNELSERENDVMQCLRMGQSNKLIARQLEITESTVKGHLKIILRKMGVQNRTQAALLATNRLNDNTPPGEAEAA